MPVIRTYQCATCEFTFQYTHPRSDDPYPPCPNCQANDPAWRPQGFRVRSNRTKATKVAQDIMERDFGLTNFRDGAREGETAAMGLTAQTTSERERMVQQVAESTRQLANAMSGTIREETRAIVKDTASLFGATGGQIATAVTQPVAAKDPAQMMELARFATAQGRLDPKVQSPMHMLHSGLKSGNIDPLRTQIMARAPIK